MEDERRVKLEHAELKSLSEDLTQKIECEKSKVEQLHHSVIAMDKIFRWVFNTFIGNIYVLAIKGEQNLASLLMHSLLNLYV